MENVKLMIATRDGNNHKKGELAVLVRTECIDSEDYHFLRLVDTYRDVGPSAESYWKEYQGRPLQKPWLIQRAGFRQEPRPAKDGMQQAVDDILTFDYMGSAEFEFGALPKSLKEITTNVEDYKIFTYNELSNWKNKSLVILARTKDEADFYFQWILKIIQGYPEAPRLKEGCHIADHLPQEYKEITDPIELRIHRSNQERLANKRQDECVWWDIKNHIWFCFDHKRMTKIYHKIVALRDNKKKELNEGWY